MRRKTYVPSYIPTEAEAIKALQKIPNITIGRRIYSRREIYESPALQEELSRKNPTRALQLFIVSDNESLGRVFAQVHEENPEYSEIVKHIQERFGVIRIRKQESKLKQQILDEERKLWKQAVQREQRQIRSRKLRKAVG